MDFDEIGRTISIERKAQKISQQQLASDLGMSRSTISGIETNTIVEVGFRKILRACSVLGLEIIIRKKTGRPTLQQLMDDNND